MLFLPLLFARVPFLVLLLMLDRSGLARRFLWGHSRSRLGLRLLLLDPLLSQLLALRV